MRKGKPFKGGSRTAERGTRRTEWARGRFLRKDVTRDSAVKAVGQAPKRTAQALETPDPSPERSSQAPERPGQPKESSGRAPERSGQGAERPDRGKERSWSEAETAWRGAERSDRSAERSGHEAERWDRSRERSGQEAERRDRSRDATVAAGCQVRVEKTKRTCEFKSGADASSATFIAGLSSAPADRWRLP
jgi:hypothetical protein